EHRDHLRVVRARGAHRVERLIEGLAVLACALELHAVRDGEPVVVARRDARHRPVDLLAACPPARLALRVRALDVGKGDAVTLAAADDGAEGRLDVEVARALTD